MTVSLKKWGNSLALRIPKDIANTLDIDNNSLIELDIKNGVLTMRPKKSNLLETLVSQINSENLHKEVDTGRSVGNEEW
ncbi:MAG: Programmed cell death antitoxin MazE [uncultured Sulfurovum sp.]|uniref:Programmed cell death antitoxin MazE n=1 Tax=uncultured Sulfurovum sp. TaxID=269237 RepID=A0A6S6SRB4_9BACT|nr:MAG: Programmed cell death antitoxin MazE [uncultured Sulfurovum sp.]